MSRTIIRTMSLPNAAAIPPRPRAPRLALLPALWLACLSGEIATAQVELRGNTPAPEGQVLRVDADGVVISQTAPTGKPASKPLVLSWDRVRTVKGPLAAQASVYALIATQAWRARARLERGDVVGAEPLLDTLFAAYSRRAGATSISIAEGLTICRLGRGAQTSAVGPWLVWLRAGGNEQQAQGDDATSTLAATTADASGRRFVPDASTGLIPSLPPIWIDVPAVRSFARSGLALDPLDAGIAATPASIKAQRLGNLYLIAAQQACGLDAPSPEATSESSADANNDPGIKLVSEVVLAMSGPPEQREPARAALRARIKNKPAPWIEAWARVALGRSLLQEVSLDAKRLGVIELLHVPSRLADDVPYLTGIALAEASVALHAFGDDAGAERMRIELQTDYSGHPALDWAPLRAWKSPIPQAPATLAPDGPDPSKAENAKPDQRK